MDEGQIRAAVESERLSLADFLDDLEETEWAVRSLCPDWTVREVVAHLTIPTRTSLPGMVVGMLKARGDFHRMTSRGARARAAACTPAQLTQQLRGSAGSARRMPGSGPMAPLIDVLVHGQDIARPLGRLAGLMLVATDTGHTLGDGPQQVRGPTDDLLLAATGRPAGLASLSGDGVARLAGRLPAPVAR